MNAPSRCRLHAETGGEFVERVATSARVGDRVASIGAR